MRPIHTSEVRPEPATVFTLRQRVVGTLAGAAFCGIARAGASAAFFCYASHWWDGGGGWEAAVMPALISGMVGLPMGAVAGWTCQPLMGALFGGASSGASCFCLYIVPAELLLAITKPGGIARFETLEAVGGLTAMIVAGAIAGGLGAAAGKYAGGAETAASRHRKRKR
jgi:hypothetical protein